MPALDKPLAELKTYQGINPRPADFDAFWDEALEEVAGVDPAPELLPVDALGHPLAETFHLYFTGVGGARIYAKYLRPKVPSGGKSPALLQFHGYSGNSGDWLDKLPYVAAGMTVAAMDCRGQGGKSQDPGGVSGNTLQGHIVRGLAEGPRHLLFRKLFLDTVQLARVVRQLSGVEELYCSGASQGGGLSIACAALVPEITRCVSIYPFLSDYKRVWEMDLCKDAYRELQTHLRNFDPLHENEDKIFETLGYIDVQNLAPRIRGRVLMALTLMDNICPPSTQFAVFNKIISSKEAAIYQDFGHEFLPGLADRIFRFFTAP